MKNDLTSMMRNAASRAGRARPGAWLRYPEHAWHALLSAFVVALAALAAFAFVLAGRVQDDLSATAKSAELAPLVTRQNLVAAFEYLDKKAARTAYLKATPPSIVDPSR